MNEVLYGDLARLFQSQCSGDAANFSFSFEEIVKELGSDAAIRAVIRCAVTWKRAPSEKALGAIAALRTVRTDARVASLLTDRLSSRSAAIRYGAAYVLKNVPQANAFDALKDSALNDSNEDVRICSLHALLALALGNASLRPAVADLCVSSIRHKSHGVRHAGYECLAHLGGTGHAVVLKAAAKDPNAMIAKSAATWLDEYLGR